MPQVHPNILRWARETAGLDLREASKRIGLGPTKAHRPEERLAALEAGEQNPSRSLLVRMAKQYRRPLLTFYLPEPPTKADHGQDFRTLPQGPSVTDEALLDALLRDIQARQSLVRSALEDEEGLTTLPFIGSMHKSSGVLALVSSMRSVLDMPLEDYRKASDSSAAFSLLRSRAEAAGIFVLLVGNLGSYHSTISLETFRGFTIADAIAPFVVINDQDSPAAWSFTLLHEMTHLWLGQTGVSNQVAQHSIEKFCNDVASEFLLPSDELKRLNLAPSPTITQAKEIVREVSSKSNVSSSMVAYRLYRARIIDQSTWQRLRTDLRENWAQQKLHKREERREQKGGPNYYIVKKHRIGSGLLEVVARLVNAGEMTTTKAGRVLGVKPHQVSTLFGTTPPMNMTL